MMFYNPSDSLKSKKFPQFSPNHLCEYNGKEKQTKLPDISGELFAQTVSFHYFFSVCTKAVAYARYHFNHHCDERIL
jgi:hypothetical protein